MKLPRNVKIFRGQLDAAPLASVLFLMLMFLTLNSDLVFTPGVRIELPDSASDRPLSGITNSSVAVAIDSEDRFYFANRALTEDELFLELKKAVQRSIEPLVLVVQADQASQMKTAFRLLSKAGEIGFKEALWASRTQPLPPVKSGVVR